MQTNGKDIYVNIKELPLINQVQAGDFFIVETTAGTNIVDFSNIIIPPENTTFYGDIEQLQTDVDALSTLYVLQNALIATVSGILDTKIDTVSAELTTQIDNLSTNYFEAFLFVQGGGTWDASSDQTTQPGFRCIFEKTGVGNYSVIFSNDIAACTVTSDADITNVTSIAQNVATIQTYNLSYTFNISGGASATSAISAIDTTLAKQPYDALTLSVMAF
jgi:hypothetical protein